MELSEDDPEIKERVTLATEVEVPKKTLLDRFERFSSWQSMKKAITLCLRYLKLLQLQRVNRDKDSLNFRKQTIRRSVRATFSKKKPILKQRITVEQIQVAETRIIKILQNEFFEDEIMKLRSIDALVNQQDRTSKAEKKSYLKGHSRLYRLDPFLDADGVLRVGGRLRHSSVSDNVKFPIILPKASHITTLIIRHYHEQVCHQGRGMTMNEIRSNGYWIVSGVSAVGSFISKCVVCQRLRGPGGSQKMANFPKDRLEPAPPFTYCAVDYFGPWYIKERRKEVKRYGVLFTCMSSRAIHLETSVTMETDSFINALRRFICRRGPIRQIRSDRGTNFVGANKELKQAVAEFNHEKITSELLSRNCDWIDFKFNVPSASHMGGVWERQIRTVRSVLSSLLQSNGSQLDDESLRTLMCETEAIVNSRPLTVKDLSDPDSLQPLSPNHLLTMKSRVILPPPGVFGSPDKYLRKRWRRIQHLANEFWSRWRKEFLLSLQERQKWCNPCRNFCIGDIVLLKDANLSRNL